jgi:hypothetical protein
MKDYHFYTFLLAAFTSVNFILASACSNQDNRSGEIKPVSFELSSQVFNPARTYQLGLGDLDEDGDPDAVFSNQRENFSQVLLNDGRGHFVDTGQQLTQHGHGVGIGDLDDDGDLDLIITCAGYEHRSRIYMNDGRGNFHDSGQDLGDRERSGNDVALFDMDGDKDLDALIVYHQEDDKVYLNNGKGQFVDLGIIFPEQSTIGDLDSDGDVDIFCREEKKGYRVKLNGGTGHFYNHCFVADDSVIRGFTGLGDIDNDGDLDVVVTNGDRTTSFPAKVFVNDGTGVLTDSSQILSAVKAGRVGVGDINGDEYVDLVLTSFGQPNEVWINDGSGRFQDSGTRLEDKGAFHGCLIRDLDLDGDLDLFIANYTGGSNEIWFNRTK